jgi:glycosyltransferase involved in cell wall biosynthesis
MACGTPVVCSNTSGLPKVAGDAALLVDPADVWDLAGAIEWVLTDERLRAELTAKGLERARQFTWERAAAMTVEVYQGVLGPGRMERRLDTQ